MTRLRFKSGISRTFCRTLNNNSALDIAVDKQGNTIDFLLSEHRDIIEQDHRRVKQRVYARLGFKRFGNAAITIGGIELAHKIKKGQFDLSGLGLDEGKVPQI